MSEMKQVNTIYFKILSLIGVLVDSGMLSPARALKYYLFYKVH